MTRESCQLLIQSATGTNTTAYAVQTLAVNLNLMADLLNNRLLQTNIVIYFQSNSLKNTKVIETIRYGMLEMQEHLETFFDRKDHVTEVRNTTSTTTRNNIYIFSFLVY